MIISLDTESEHYTKKFHLHQIFLNGLLQENVVYADSEVGIIKRQEKNKDGESIFHNNEFVLLTITGDVKIISSEGVCRTRMHDTGNKVLAYDTPINIYADGLGVFLILDFDISDDGKITIHNAKPYYELYCDIER